MCSGTTPRIGGRSGLCWEGIVLFEILSSGGKRLAWVLAFRSMSSQTTCHFNLSNTTSCTTARKKYWLKPKTLLTAIMPITTWFALALGYSSCQSLSRTNHTRAVASGSQSLTLATARERRAQVKSVHYDTHIFVGKDSEMFSGESRMEVSLHHQNHPLQIDLKAEKIESVIVNQKTIPLDYKNWYFEIPPSYLQAENTIVIRWEARHSDAGGFHRFVDPEDNSTYLFTDLQPASAHTVFPCFDQPDIKGVFELSITHPSEWIAIGNQPRASVPVQDKNAAAVTTRFRPTPPLSTYLFFVGAGNYVTWTDQWKNIPLAIHARRSLQDRVDHKELFRLTKLGLDYFSALFDSPYPFLKYDHVFAPGLGPGAMENPGAVTMNESKIFDGPQPATTHADRANLVFHEMAHMWFGNLVTMTWWDDLWLNESFATYTAYLAQAEAQKSSYAWKSFFEEKIWGYAEDQLITTHPIENSIEDVGSALNYFDGITYAKGAASLKQLHRFVGDAGFRIGIRNYFKKHAWKNTTRQDFTSEISKASGVNLDEWTRSWLQSSGPNSILTDFECGKGNSKKNVTIRAQSQVNQSGVHSPRATQVALLYRSSLGGVRVKHSASLLFKDQIELRLEGQACPDAIFANYQDYDYALYPFDAKSLELYSRYLDEVRDPLIKKMIWNGFQQMEFEGRISSVQYLEIFSKFVAHEKDPEILASVIGLWAPIGRILNSSLTSAQRKVWGPRVSQMARQRIESFRRVGDIELMWLDFYLSHAWDQNPKGAESRFLERLLTDKLWNGFQLDQERRWKALYRLSFNGHPKSAQWLIDEFKRDSSFDGEVAKFQAEVAFPNQSSKDASWKKLLGEDITWAIRHQAFADFHHPDYPELTRSRTSEFIELLIEKSERAQDMGWELESFIELSPDDCSAEFVDALQTLLRERGDLHPLISHGLKKSADLHQRCVERRKKFD